MASSVMLLLRPSRRRYGIHTPPRTYTGVARQIQCIVSITSTAVASRLVLTGAVGATLIRSRLTLVNVYEEKEQEEDKKKKQDGGNVHKR